MSGSIADSRTVAAAAAYASGVLLASGSRDLAAIAFKAFLCGVEYGEAKRLEN